MSLMRYFDPFEELEQVQRELDRFFGDGGRSRSSGRDQPWRPAVELRERDNDYELSLDLPGMTKDDVEVTVTEDTLSVEGERKFEREEEQENVHYVERRYGKFSRNFSLPSNADPDAVSAEFEDGVLRVNVAKREEEESRRIAIE